MFSAASSQTEVTLVITAVTSIALASRLVGELNRVTSPVCAATPTRGQAERTWVMPPSAISPVLAHPASANIVVATRASLRIRKGTPFLKP
jgi:hypothetical protein